MPKDLKICDLLDVYGEFLSEKQRSLCEHYYNEDLSLSEIAENENITRQGVRDIIARATAQLERYEAVCGYSRKFNRLKALSRDVSANADEICGVIDTL